MTLTNSRRTTSSGVHSAVVLQKARVFVVVAGHFLNEQICFGPGVWVQERERERRDKKRIETKFSLCCFVLLNNLVQVGKFRTKERS